ncbi:TNF receptor-associated protein 1, mitochondrial [Bulinus truncatus]|nr:TNF receptor-associated protein 1, mitochondrial [Bulinus truncatus]
MIGLPYRLPTCYQNSTQRYAVYHFNFDLHLPVFLKMAASIRTCYLARSTFNSVHQLKFKLRNDSLRCVPLYVSSKRNLFNAVPSHELKNRSKRNNFYDTHSKYPQRSFLTSVSLNTTQEDVKVETEDDYHSIIKDTERGKGQADVHEFQAETRKLLDIVAKSLYSEKEVFIRELISNSSDALEKLRYYELTGAEVSDQNIPLEIHIATNDDKKTFTIQDTGVGLTKEELIDNLGTIARSGSKAFLDQLSDKAAQGNVKSNLIGQFGVGFYSTFMVGDKVDVFTKSFKPGSSAYKWASDGSYKVNSGTKEDIAGTYTMTTCFTI